VAVASPLEHPVSLPESAIDALFRLIRQPGVFDTAYLSDRFDRVGAVHGRALRCTLDTRRAPP
jgi:hypothetical protein